MKDSLDRLFQAVQNKHEYYIHESSVKNERGNIQAAYTYIMQAITCTEILNMIQDEEIEANHD